MYEKVNIPIITKFSLKLSYFQSFLLFLIDFKDFYKTKLDRVTLITALLIMLLSS